MPRTQQQKPFVDVNCAALSDSLLESELFGYKAGAFISAMRDKPGRISLTKGGRLLLNEFFLKVMSMGFLHEKQDTPTIWRGPLKGAAIRQFIADSDWGELDYLIIDAPPGTEDDLMTGDRSLPDAGTLLVTTPQEIALADVRKSISFCRTLNLHMVGLVQNMSGLHCPHCGELIPLFGADGAEQMAQQQGVSLLGSLPLDPEVVRQGDRGETGSLEACSREYREDFMALMHEVQTALPLKKELAIAKDL